MTRHPEDYAVWDAGEPIAMLADALEVIAREERDEKARESRDAPVAAA